MTWCRRTAPQPPLLLKLEEELPKPPRDEELEELELLLECELELELLPQCHQPEREEELLDVLVVQPSANLSTCPAMGAQSRREGQAYQAPPATPAPSRTSVILEGLRTGKVYNQQCAEGQGRIDHPAGREQVARQRTAQDPAHGAA